VDAAEHAAITVKGRVGLTANIAPDAAAEHARAAVLEEVERPWRRPISRGAAPWLSRDEVDGSDSDAPTASNGPMHSSTTTLWTCG
jgi:hypothetical protein